MERSKKGKRLSNPDFYEEEFQVWCKESYDQRGVQEIQDMERFESEAQVLYPYSKLYYEEWKKDIFCMVCSEAGQDKVNPL